MFEEVFRNRRLVKERLTLFGFTEREGGYQLSRSLANGLLEMKVFLSLDGKIYTQVMDLDSGEEYVLHRVSGACGAFVGRVKEEYDAILSAVETNCFELDVFKSAYARQVIQYVRETYQDELEFLWKRVPDNAIFRRKDTNKWYGALLVVSRRKLGLPDDEKVDILDLRICPEELEMVIDNKGYFPGYHMNKKHWCTICLDGTVPIEEIYRRIDMSYRLSIK